MARVTIEGCLRHIPNRFDLVHVAARRARELLDGGTPMVDKTEDNGHIVNALREVEAGRVNKDSLDNLDLGSVNYEATFSDLASQAKHVKLSNNFDDEDEEGVESVGPDGEPISGAALEQGAELEQTMQPSTAEAIARDTVDVVDSKADDADKLKGTKHVADAQDKPVSMKRDDKDAPKDNVPGMAETT